MFTFKVFIHTVFTETMICLLLKMMFYAFNTMLLISKIVLLKHNLAINRTYV